MAEYNVRINVKNDTGYDQLYPESKSNIIEFDNSNSNLASSDVESGIKEVNTKATTANSTANTNKTNIGTLASLTTDSKTNLVEAINEVDSHADSAQTTANSANSTANTNKTNIGTLSNLKTAIKTNIVNAINNLYDNTIGKTLTNLEDVNLATEEGYYVDALAIKELNEKLSGLESWNRYRENFLGTHTYLFSFGKINGGKLRTNMLSIPWTGSEVNFNLVKVNVPGLAVIPTDYKIAYISSQGGLYIYCDTLGANGSQDLQYQVAECDINISKK